MKMHPEYFFEAFVVGNFEDFAGDPGSVRKGINAALSAFHMADHFYHYHERHAPARIAAHPKLRSFHIQLATTCVRFRDIQSIANSYKHLYIDTGKAHVLIDSTGAIESVGNDKFAIGCEWEPGTNKMEVGYRTKGGEFRLLLPALQEVVAMWHNLLRGPDCAVPKHL